MRDHAEKATEIMKFNLVRMYELTYVLLEAVISIQRDVTEDIIKISINDKEENLPDITDHLMKVWTTYIYIC